MLTVVSGTKSQLSPGLEVALATYRHEVFIEALGWQLPVENGLERDQFDRPDTLYVVAQDTCGSVCGCARLLPTTQAYLLDEVFPGLMNGLPAPHACVGTITILDHVYQLDFYAVPRGGQETFLRPVCGCCRSCDRAGRHSTDYLHCHGC